MMKVITYKKTDSEEANNPMNNIELLEIIKKLLKTDANLDFLLELPENDLKTLVGCIRERVDAMGIITKSYIDEQEFGEINMSKNGKSDYDWFSELINLCKSINNPLSVLKNVYKRDWDQESFAAIKQELCVIARRINDLRWYLCSNPLNKYLSGQQLTREEFYLLAAQGGLIVHSASGLEAYDEWKYFLYEDNEIRGYINTSTPPPIPILPDKGPQTIYCGLGVVPEDVRASFLSPDQTKFFKKFHSELFSRFRKD